MRYARNHQNERIEVEFSGQKAKCGICDSDVIGRKGEIREKHWAHRKDCDSWGEPITEWHLKWQNYFPEENREVVVRDGEKAHRADVRLNNGMVIEIQHSPITPKILKAREEFYGRKNMIWILNGVSLAKHSELRREKYPYRYYIIIEVPTDLPNNPGYLTESFLGIVSAVFSSEYSYDVQYTSNKIVISSLNDIIIREELELIHFKYSCVSAYEYTYGTKGLETYRNGLKIYNKTEKVDQIKFNLDKKYWRAFIDRMEYPVFIDELKGLEQDEIFWYQEMKVFKKEKFLEKYLYFTGDYLVGLIEEESR